MCVAAATEVRSARTYWHVQSPDSGVARIYPEMYTPRVVGMVWSLLAQEQTWFGNEPYKSYGIQVFVTSRKCLFLNLLRIHIAISFSYYKLLGCVD